jgi:hypothetical protein
MTISNATRLSGDDDALDAWPKSGAIYLSDNLGCWLLARGLDEPDTLGLGKSNQRSADLYEIGADELLALADAYRAHRAAEARTTLQIAAWCVGDFGDDAEGSR